MAFGWKGKGISDSWGKDTQFYTLNRSVAKGEIVAVKATRGMQLVSFSLEYLQIYLSLPGNSLNMGRLKNSHKPI